MDSTNSDACFKAFNILCEALSSSDPTVTVELHYWIFERGYIAGLEASAIVNKLDTKFLDAAWSTQPSLEQDFSLH